MSATYNWSIRPGIENRYGFGVAESDDDVKPSNCCYVALFGNDETGNGSRMKPFKTIVKVQSLDFTNIIVASGVYREKLIGNTYAIYADGDVVIDSEFTADRMFIANNCYGLKLRGGFYQEAVYYISYNNCDFDRVSPGRIDDTQISMGTFRFNTVKKATIAIQQENYIVPSYRAIENNTFYNCNIYINGINSAFLNVFNMCIFVNCNIDFCGIEPKYMTYCIFHNCRFKNLGGTVYRDLYPTIPPGFDDTITTIEDLRTFLGTIEGLSKCIIADPKFNNPEVGDYSLAFNSPAKNLSYFGTYVGAQSIGYPIRAKIDASVGDFDMSTAVNVVVEDNSIRFADESILATIETVVKVNSVGRPWAKASVYGKMADRNGQYIDSIPDLSNVAISAGTDLAPNTPYLTGIGAITYNGTVIPAGGRFTTTNVVEFTTESGGVCYEITEAPQRHTIEARFYDGGEVVPLGDSLNQDSWYFVTGTVLYGGVEYTNEIFKANSYEDPGGGYIDYFTGLGEVREAMPFDLPYQHFEMGIPFKSNNVGDVRTGTIIRGNGDPLYERGPNKEFEINSRYAQIRFTLRPDNLIP